MSHQHKCCKAPNTKFLTTNGESFSDVALQAGNCVRGQDSSALWHAAYTVGARRGAMDGLKPEYPSQARANGLTGSGAVLLKIDARTGYVTSASMSKSTGHETSITQPCELFASGVSDQEV